MRLLGGRREGDILGGEGVAQAGGGEPVCRAPRGRGSMANIAQGEHLAAVLAGDGGEVGFGLQGRQTGQGALVVDEGEE